MKNPILSILLILSLAFVTGCKTASTRSRTDFFDAAGKKIATRKEHTHVTGFLVKSDSVALKGTLNYTNTAPGFTMSEGKVFSADKVTYSGDADSIGAAGTAVGNAVKAATGK